MSATRAEVRLTLYGPPRTKKTSNRLKWVQLRPARRGRSGQRARRWKVLPSAAWCAWRDRLLLEQRCLVTDFNMQAWHFDYEAPLTDPANCQAIFYREADVGDAVGYYQGLADVLQALGIVDDDRRLVSWDGSRLAKDAKNPRVEITLTWEMESAA